jgi:hypothetical protein
METPDNFTTKIVHGIGHFIQHEVPVLPKYLSSSIATEYSDVP